MGIFPNGAAAESVGRQSSITEAINWISREAGDLSCVVDALVARLGPVTRNTDSKASCEPRPIYACELAESLAGQASYLAAIRLRLTAQLDTLELP